MENNNDFRISTRIDQMEQILLQTQKQNRRLMRIAFFFGLLLLVFVLIFAYGFFQLNQTVSTATEDLPELISNTNNVVEDTGKQLNTVLSEIESVDFEALNDSIHQVDEGLGSIDFEKLNESIENLQSATERFSNFTNSIFGSPFLR